MRFNKEKYLNSIRGMPFNEIWKALGEEAERRYKAENKNIIAYRLADKFFGYWNTGWNCLVCGASMRGLKSEIKHKKDCDLGKLLK